MSIEIERVGEDELIMFHTPKRKKANSEGRNPKAPKPRKTRRDKGRPRPKLQQVIIDPETGDVSYE